MDLMRTSGTTFEDGYMNNAVRGVCALHMIPPAAQYTAQHHRDEPPYVQSKCQATEYERGYRR